MAKLSRQARLNIYLDSAEIRRKIKMKAAEEDISVSEYCRRLLVASLSGEKGQAKGLEQAVQKAREFQSRTFGGKVFRVSSAELIREAREDR